MVDRQRWSGDRYGERNFYPIFRDFLLCHLSASSTVFYGHLASKNPQDDSWVLEFSLRAGSTFFCHPDAQFCDVLHPRVGYENKAVPSVVAHVWTKVPYDFPAKCIPNLPKFRARYSSRLIKPAS